MEIKVSQSEVGTFNSCEKKHEYAFLDKLEPMKSSPGISLGTAGHYWFEVFFKTGSVDMANSAVIQEHLLDAPKVISYMSRWMTEVYPRVGWEPQAIEEKLNLEVGEIDGHKIIFPFTADLIVKDRQGYLALIDHKFIKDFYSEQSMELAKQMPLYIGALRALGTPVKYAQYNFIRTRSNAAGSIFSQPIVPASDIKIQTLFADQIKVMKRIAKLKIKNAEGNRPTAVRVAEPFSCKFCHFAEICSAELNGEDTTMIRKMGYKANSYGY